MPLLYIKCTLFVNALMKSAMQIKFDWLINGEFDNMEITKQTKFNALDLKKYYEHVEQRD